MKKVILICVILSVVIILSSCGLETGSTEPVDLQTTVMTVENLDNMYLVWLNRDLNANYESFDKALTEQIIIYEADKSRENLYRVCLVLSEMPNRANYNNMIISYYENLLESMSTDNEYMQYINSNWNRLFKRTSIASFFDDYIEALYQSDMKDKFEYIVNNLDLYISEPEEIIKTAAYSSINIDPEKGIDNERRLMLQVLLKYEDKYAYIVNNGHKLILALNIAEYAQGLGEFDLADEYNRKKDELKMLIINEN